MADALSPVPDDLGLRATGRGRRETVGREYDTLPPYQRESDDGAEDAVFSIELQRERVRLTRATPYFTRR